MKYTITLNENISKKFNDYFDITKIPKSVIIELALTHFFYDQDICGYEEMNKLIENIRIFNYEQRYFRELGQEKG